MNMRTVNDPYGGNAPLVDKFIGNAYDTVRYVALNLAYIKHVSYHLHEVYDVAHNMLDVLNVSKNMKDVNTVATITAEIKLLAAQIDGLVSLAANLPALLNIDENIATLIDLSKSADALVDLHEHQAEYLAVYQKLPSIEAILPHLTEIGAVFDNLTEVVAVGDHIAAVQNVNDNMARILNVEAELALINQVANQVDELIAQIAAVETGIYAKFAAQDGLKNIGSVPSWAALKTLVPTAAGQRVFLKEYEVGTGYGGGIMISVNAAGAEDGGYRASVNANWHWKRDVKNTSELTIIDFGAIPNGTSDAGPAIKRMHDWSTADALALNLASTYGNGVVLPTGAFGIGALDLGDSEIGAFKIRGPECNFGVIPRVTLLPINKTTTTPAFAFRARRMEVSNIHWDGKGSVQPFMVNRVTRGAYVRVGQFVSTDAGGRCFQVKDTIDTKLNQVYSYRGSAAFFFAGWSNENPGGWNHSTAIELSNFNFSSHTGEYAFLAVRAGQSMMYNGWFDRNEYPFDISQGGWTLDNITMENSANPAAVKYAKIIEIGCRWAQGATLSKDATSYDPAWDNGAALPGSVTNAYDQGKVAINMTGSLFDCGVAAQFNWSNNVLNNTRNEDSWFYIGRIVMPRQGDSCKMRLVGAANWDSATGDFNRPGGTSFGSGEAIIHLEMKQPQQATTTSVEAHWYGSGNCPISAVKIVHSWQSLGVYVRMRQYAKFAALFQDVTGIPRINTGDPTYFRPDGTYIADADLAAVANLVDVPARFSFNGGDYAGNGLGMNLDTGDLVMFQKNKVMKGAAEYIPVFHNGMQRYIQIQEFTGAHRMPYVNMAELATMSPATWVYHEVLVSNGGVGSGNDTQFIKVFSDGLRWIDAATYKAVSTTGA